MFYYNWINSSSEENKASRAPSEAGNKHLMVTGNPQDPNLIQKDFI